MPAEEVGFQRVVVGDARHAVELALIGHRVDGFRRCEGGDEMDLVLEDQILGDFGRSVRIGLAVLDDKLQRMDGAIDFNRIVERFPGVVEGVRHLLIEQRQWTGLGGDQADLDGLRYGEGWPRDRGDRCAGGETFEHHAAQDARQALGHRVPPDRRFFRH